MRLKREELREIIERKPLVHNPGKYWQCLQEDSYKHHLSLEPYTKAIKYFGTKQVNYNYYSSVPVVKKDGYRGLGLLCSARHWNCSVRSGGGWVGGAKPTRSLKVLKKSTNQYLGWWRRWSEGGGREGGRRWKWRVGSVCLWRCGRVGHVGKPLYFSPHHARQPGTVRTTNYYQ